MSNETYFGSAFALGVSTAALPVIFVEVVIGYGAIWAVIGVVLGAWGYEAGVALHRSRRQQPRSAQDAPSDKRP